MDLATINSRLTTLENDLATCLATTEPSVPTSCVAVFNLAQTQATVTFGTPVSNGGSAITGYTVTATPGSQTVSGASSPLVVTGLTGGNSLYTFEVRAVNAVGHSVPCVSAAVGTATATGSVGEFMVAVGAGYANTIAYAADGIDWRPSGTTVFTVQGNAVAYNGSGRWIAVGSGTNTVGYSDDGINWTGLPAPVGTISAGTGIAYSATQSRWVMTGSTATNKIAYSNDNGLTWTGVTGATIFSTSGNGVAFDGISKWVAVGTGGNGAAYSSDGISWTGVTTPPSGATCVAHNGVDLWIVSGSGNYSSPDGITWTLLSATIVQFGGVSFANGRWMTSDRAYSFNGRHFATYPQSNSLNSSFSSPGACVASNGNAWIFGGIVSSGYCSMIHTSDAYQLSSGSGYTVTGLGRPIFHSACYGIASRKLLPRNDPLPNPTPRKLILGGAVSWDGFNIAQNQFTASGAMYGGSNLWISTLGQYSTNNGLDFVASTNPNGLSGGAGIAYNGTNVWLIGSGSVVYHSIDNGVGWYGIPTGCAPLTIAFNGTNQWVIGGTTTDKLAYSSDGARWTGLGSTIFTTACQHIAHDGVGRYVAVGSGTHTIATSTDGISWTGLGLTTFNSLGRAVAHDGVGRWVATGETNNTIATSTNGTTWTGLGLSYLTSTVNRCLAYHQTLGMWFACGSTTAVYTNNVVWSRDGINWATFEAAAELAISAASITTEHRLPYTALTPPAAFPANHQMVLVGQDTGGTRRPVVYSPDGRLFGNTNVAVATTSYLGVAYNGTNKWLAGGVTTSIQSSTDGKSWSAISVAATFSSQVNCFAYSASLTRWVAGGSGTNGLAYSNDNGATWTGTGTAQLSNAQGVAYNGTNRFVAVGQGATNRIAYSTDGITWTGTTGLTLFDGTGLGVCFSTVLSRWVAVGSSSAANTIAYSPDGITWTGLGMTVFSTQAFAVAYNGLNRFVAVGQGTNTVAYSTDGISWTGLGSILGTVMEAVAYNPASTRWMVGGSGTNTAAYSTDNGLTWTGEGALVLATIVRGIAAQALLPL